MMTSWCVDPLLRTIASITSPGKRRTLLAPVMRFPGLDYRHGAAEDAWRRIVDCFDEHLGAPVTS